MRRWFAYLSVVAIAAVGALSALPAGAGRLEPNCLVDNLISVPVEVGPAVPAPPLIVAAVCTEVEVAKVVTGEPGPA